MDLLVGPSQEALDGSPTGMLKRNRGYMIKIVENTEDRLEQKERKIQERLEVLSGILETKKE